MYFDYEYTNDLGMAAVVIAFVAVVLLVWLFGLAAYVLRSISLYTIAKRRGLNNPWLAWLPVGQDWILGNVADQYKYLVQGKNQSWRYALLTLSAVGVACSAVVMWMAASVTANMAASSRYMSDAQVASAIMTPVLGLMLVEAVSAVVNIAAFVFRCLCKYDLYRSCDPKNAVAFLVVGILLGVTEPFFLLACRKKDLGMPPRKPEPVPEIPQIPEDPWEE